MTTQFSSPTTVLLGDDALEQMALRVAALSKRILLVTDPGVAQLGLHRLVLEPLAAAGVDTTVFAEVAGNPDTNVVEAAHRTLRQASATVVVAVGGGSSLDVAKSVAVLATNGGSIADYEGTERMERSPLPVIAIPTTVGSGSEVTKGAVITNPDTKVKMIIVSDRMFPLLAVLDRRMVAQLPPKITATTGMDALTHAIEAYVAKGASPITDAINLGAIELIADNLRQACAGDADALYAMLIASTMAGIGFHDAGLGAVHALANTLGAHFGVHHGTANALFLPYVMDFNVPAAPARFARIARALGEDVTGLDDEKAAAKAAAAVHRLAEDTGVPRKLADVGVPRDAVDTLAYDALTQADLPGNPRPCGEEDLKALYRAAL